MFLGTDHLKNGIRQRQNEIEFPNVLRVLHLRFLQIKEERKASFPLGCKLTTTLFRSVMQSVIVKNRREHPKKFSLDLKKNKSTIDSCRLFLHRVSSHHYLYHRQTEHGSNVTIVQWQGTGRRSQNKIVRLS